MIHLGYEVGTGASVSIPFGHTIFLGATGRAGKTTALEALAVRSHRACLAFITKPNEQSLRAHEWANEIAPFYDESDFDWQTVRLICEALTDRWDADQRRMARLVCEDGETGRMGKANYASWKRPTSLREVLGNIQILVPKTSGRIWAALLELQADLRNAERVLSRLRSQFEPIRLKRPGLNVVDLEGEKIHIQSLVISSMIRWCREHSKRTIVCLPEVWKFTDNRRRTAVGEAAELFIREGAAGENFLWMDSQRLTGLSRDFLTQIRVWLFGVQRDVREIKEVLTAIPGDRYRPEFDDIAHLRLGHFIAAWDEELVHVYVQPLGVNDITAVAIAQGEEKPETAKGIIKEFDSRYQTERGTQ